MEISNILIPAAIFAGLGIVLGILLAVASRIFAVRTDERVEKIAEALPGANCSVRVRFWDIAFCPRRIPIWSSSFCLRGRS